VIEDIVIIGASGLAKEVAFLIEDINKDKKQWNVLGFIDGNDKHVGLEINNKPIIGTDNWIINQNKSINIAFGIGSPQLIKKLSTLFTGNNLLKFPNLIHPNVIGDWNNISFGVGNIICAGNVFTTSIHIGNFNYLNLSCTLGHDSIIGNYNVINPTVNISGGVEMGDEILLGTGSQILQYKKICSNCVVGAGSVVTKNLEEKGVYIGTPAKKI
jgi:sugar O-acyltransferase (sialic acid O-acetyltransferase NeuD family)